MSLAAGVILMLCASGTPAQPPAARGPAMSPAKPGVAPAPRAVPPPKNAQERRKFGFVERMSLKVPNSTVLIVRGQVQALSAEDRYLPEEVWPEDAPQIVTRALISVDEVVCGTPRASDLEVLYVGGEIGARWIRTSLMPSDLIPGETIVLKATEIDGELFLLGGYDDVLKDSLLKDELQGRTGETVTKAEIKEAC